MGLLSSREGKLNVIILLLVLQLFLFGLYLWTNGSKSQTESPQGTDAKVDVQQMNVQTPTMQESDCGAMLSDKVLQLLPHEALAQLYHNYVNSIQIACSKMVRHGNEGDGGWDVCEDRPYSIQKPCVVYSFGIKDDWSFDDSIVEKHGCELHAYDPSIKTHDYNRRPTLHFHKTGLGSRDETNEKGWRMRTFKSLLKENGDTETPIDVLKIDIEESEWEAFPEMLQSGSLKNVKQFCFEIHIKMNGQPEPNEEKYIRGLKLLKDIYHAGFRIFKTHKNSDTIYNSKYGQERTGCHEIYMVKAFSETQECE